MSDKKVANSKGPWTESMSDTRFDVMRQILAAPSPIGLEAAMTRGVLEPYMNSFMPDAWKIHSYQGNAGIVLDTAPGQDDMFSVMVIGHADKIRMQVRRIDDGKIWVNTDSMLPSVLIGHKVKLFSEDPDNPGNWRVIQGGTIEAVGAIHFADPKLRTGDKGIKADQIYLELQIHGKDKNAQIEALGIRPGDPLIYDRDIERGFSPDTFTGAYLDNGLGCFVTAEIGRVIAEQGGLDNVRFLGAMATHEEIGRYGSRVLTEAFQPNVTIAVDVAHDFTSAPGISDRRYEHVAMGDGYTLTHGSITSATLNSMITQVSQKHGIPVQHELAGRDTGTDAMASFMSCIDSATTSIGFPIRNMHTISETGHTGDVDAAIHAIVQTLKHMDGMNAGKGIKSQDLQDTHPRLDQSSPLTHRPAKKDS